MILDYVEGKKDGSPNIARHMSAGSLLSACCGLWVVPHHQAWETASTSVKDSVFVLFFHSQSFPYSALIWDPVKPLNYSPIPVSQITLKLHVIVHL